MKNNYKIGFQDLYNGHSYNKYFCKVYLQSPEPQSNTYKVVKNTFFTYSLHGQFLANVKAQIDAYARHFTSDGPNLW